MTASRPFRVPPPVATATTGLHDEITSGLAGLRLICGALSRWLDRMETPA